jgi:hypothetical protein
MLVGLAALPPGDGAQPASASQATPIASDSPITCDVEPRPLTEILALLKPESENGAHPVEFTPAGEPVIDPIVTAEITKVVRTLEACVNDGEQYRFLSLFSDEAFEQMRSSEENVEELTSLANSTPTPVPPDRRVTLIGPWHLRLLPDGRVMAAVLFGSADEPQPDPNFYTKVLFFVHHDQGWLIQEMDNLIWSSECDDLVRASSVVGPPPGYVMDTWPAHCQPEPRQSKRHGHHRRIPAHPNEAG